MSDSNVVDKRKPKSGLTAITEPGPEREVIAKNAITLTWEFIDPVIAQEYLKLNVSNRDVVASNVAKIASDMLDPNRWLTQAAPLQFGLSGKLIDGQHRLLAIIESNTGHWVLVARGVEDECRYVVDTNEVRRFTHQARMYGYTNVKALTSTSNLILAYRYLVDGKATIGTIQAVMSVRSNRERMAYLESIFEDVQDACNEVRKVVDGKNLNHMLPTNIMAFYYLAKKVDPARALEALQVMRDGQMTYMDDAMVLFRDYRLNGASARGGFGSQKLRYAYFMTLIRSWNKFRRLEPVKICRTVTGIEKMDDLGIDDKGFFVKLS